MDVEDVLADSIGLFGDVKEVDDTIRYGPLVLTTAPKVWMFVMFVHVRSSASVICLIGRKSKTRS